MPPSYPASPYLGGVEPRLRCSKCGGYFPVDFFNPNPKCTGRYGRNSWCRTCCSTRAREYRRANPETKYLSGRRMQLKRNFGITMEEYDALFEAQGGVCAICQRVEKTVTSRWGRTNYLSVDHDHGTGEVRGLLCNRCNRALGWLEDDPEVLRAAITYLEKSQRK